MLPYTYLIGWSKLDTWYYGSQHGKTCHPDNLWIKYFTSSDYVKEFRKLHGEPDVVRVRKTFAEPKHAIEWEYKVLRRLKVVESQRWLNKSDHKAIPPESVDRAKAAAGASKRWKGIPKSEEQKRKMWENHAIRLGKYVPTGTLHTEEAKEKIRQKAIGRKHTEETKAKLSATRIARKFKHTDEWKAAQSERIRAARANKFWSTKSKEHQLT